jgi:superfamily II DNA or RNA helicase
VKRLFTQAQRPVIYLAAKGRCQRCGCVLNPANWHADHINPFSKGGETHLRNAQALCPPCNLKKSNNMNPLQFVPSGEKLHTWQIEFIDRFLGSAKEQLANPPDKKQAFILNAFPGSGKTWAQLIVLKYLYVEGFIDFIIVCVPSVKLRDDFAEQAMNIFGMNFYAKTGMKVNTDTHQGCVITYAQLNNPLTVQTIDQWCRDKHVAVSADEMHHLSLDKKWGPNFFKAFSSSSVRLMTSGTPFRSDGDRIPWVRYVDNSIDLSAPHAYSYSYGKGRWNPSQSALSDGVVRDVVFHPWDGEVTFIVEIDDVEVTFCHKLTDNLDEIYFDQYSPGLIRSLKSYRRKFCIECGSHRYPKGTEYVREQIKAAHGKLMQIRRGSHPHAGGLIVCENRMHANAIAEVVSELTGTIPVVVHGEAGDHQKKLKAFQVDISPSREPWLIAVKMVTEGVDIKHLRVGVFLTIEMAPLFWTQVLGRILRIDSKAPKANQTAHFYQYDDGIDLVDDEAQSVRLKLFAETIMEEKEFTINPPTLCLKCKQDPCVCIKPPPVPCPVCKDSESPLFIGKCPGLGVYPCPRPPRPEPLSAINLGAIGDYSEQIYNGDRHEIKDLAFFEPLEARWEKPTVVCKHLVDLMPENARRAVYQELKEIHNHGK